MSEIFDIFFFEAFEEEERKLKEYLPDRINAAFSWKTIQEYGSELPPAKVISTRTQSEYPVHWADKLDAILSRSTGYDHLHSYMKKAGRNINCGYLPLYCNRAVAEHALMLWMALLRKLPQQIKQFNDFKRDGLTGSEVGSKNLVVYGVGNIGSEVCKIGEGLGMNVYGVEIDIKHPSFSYIGKVEAITLADIIVCAMNLNEGNRSYFNAEYLQQAKKGCIFVNVSRGEISPSSELLSLVDHLGGIGLDVFNEEKDLANSLRSGKASDLKETLAAIELAKKLNVICTPHNAFNSAEAVHNKSEQSIQQIIEYFGRGAFIWKVPEIFHH